MAWFKVDDKLHDHRKARAAGTAAMGVWLLAGSWSADNLTDGFIPATILPRWGRPRDAKRLVDAGLWHADQQDGEGGWRFHEWAERQPTRAQKLEERALKAEAGKVGGLASGRSRREAKTKQGASGQVELPSRPVPSTNKQASADADESFEEFWTRYPRKIAKGTARKAWTTAAKKVDAATLINAARSFAVRSAGADPKFIPHAATWLNGERWADEGETQKAEVAGEWFQPFNPGEAPPEIADDPEQYASWLEDRRAAWRQEGGR